MASTTTTLLIADDHPLFRSALRITLAEQLSDIQGLMLLEAESMSQVFEVIAKKVDVDLILLDLHMPGAQGFSGLAHLRGAYESLPVAVVSGSDLPRVIRQVADLGASGFISKTLAPETMAQTVRQLLAGEQCFPVLNNQISGLDLDALKLAELVARLTPHQFRVYGMIAEGLLNKQIAYELSISEPTVKSHVTAILRKLQVRDRKQLIIAAKRLEVENPARGL